MTTSPKISVTWAELLLVVLLAIGGMGAWIGAEWLEDKVFAPAEPQEEDFQSRHHVFDSQRRLTMAEEEWKATHSLLVAQSLDIEKLSARMEALEQDYPGIQKLPPAAGPVSEDTVKAYREARAQKASAVLLVKRLTGRLESSRSALARYTADLSKARRAATEEWKAATARRARGRLLVASLLAAAGVAVLFLVIRIALGGRAGQRLGLRLRLVLGAASFLLLALYLYQALGTLSAVLGSLFLLLATGALLRALAASDPGGDPR
jgi:hypothetical protein